MKKTVIIYGSSTGTCEDLAGRIGAKLGVDNVINVTDLDDSVIANNDNLILVHPLGVQARCRTTGMTA